MHGARRRRDRRRRRADRVVPDLRRRRARRRGALRRRAVRALRRRPHRHRHRRHAWPSCTCRASPTRCARRNRRVTAAVVPDGESSKSLARAEEMCESFAREGLDRARAHRRARRRRGRRSRRLRRVDLLARRRLRAGADDAAGAGRLVGGRQDRRQPAGGQEPGRARFWQPRLVYADVTTLATLSDARPRRRAGRGHQARAHRRRRRCSSCSRATRPRRAPASPRSWPSWWRARARIKARVVGGDERETTGRARAAQLRPHRRARARVGVARRARSAAPRRGGRRSACWRRRASRRGARAAARRSSRASRALLDAVGLPTDLDRRLSPGTLARVAVDKKRGGDHIHFVVVDEPGTRAPDAACAGADPRNLARGKTAMIRSTHGGRCMKPALLLLAAASSARAAVPTTTSRCPSSRWRRSRRRPTAWPRPPPAPAPSGATAALLDVSPSARRRATSPCR